MITTADLDRVLAMMQDHGLQSLRVKAGSAVLMLRLATDGEVQKAQRQEVVVRTRAIGRFLRGYPGRTGPLVKVGDAVNSQTIVGMLETGPVLSPILAGQAGEIARMEAEEGALLGFGAPVMTIFAGE